MKNNKIFRRNNPGTALSREAHLSGGEAALSPAGHLSLSPFSLLRSPGRGRAAALLLLLCPAVALADETPDLLVCNSKGYMLKPAVAAAGTSLAYKWYEKSGSGAYTAVGSETSASLTVNAGKAAGTYSYVRTVTGTGCTDEVASNTYTVVVLAPTAPTITAPGNECQGVADLVFSASGDAGSTFTWTGGNTPSGAGNATYTVPKSSTALTYSLQATASVAYSVNGLDKTCTSGSSTVAEAAINPLPVVTDISSTTAWCGSGSHDLEVEAKVNGSAAGVTVAWYDNINGSGAALSSTTSYTVPASDDPDDVKVHTFYVKATVGATSCVNNPLATITGTRNLFEGAIDGNEL